MQWHPREVFVDGAWTTAGGTPFDVVDPATEEVLGQALAADDAAVAAAVTSARRAFDTGGWPRWDLEKRIAAVEGLAAELERRSAEIVRSHTAQMGAPVTVSRAMVASTARLVAAYVAGAREVEASYLRRDGAVWFLVQRGPVGVVAAVTPWNGPLAALINKVVPALLAGCTVVLKPAPETPFEAGVLAESAVAAGIPAGVLNVVTGGAATGEALITDPRVDKITFTGSTAVGHRVGEIAGRAFVRQSLELGGKSAAIVLDDADLAATVPHLVNGNFFNSGQACIAITRVLVPASRADEIVAALRVAAEALVVGDPLDEATDLGPLVSRRQRGRVEELIASGVAEGATLVTGGTRPDDLPRGFYLRPAVFTGVHNGMRIAREEVFGPVLSVLTYTGEDEAVALANDSPYGLHGAVFGADPARALAVARRLHTGSVAINGSGLTPAAPYGGVKGSGIGREHGAEGYAAFLEYTSYIVPEDLASALRSEGVGVRA